ncbi:hypothetical protein [Inhella crocodyli]|uniref:Uncharacterized protein n=1 Tax=Inhella crocodyli TaxID=2499851 RepID=A0A3S2XM40_9BURK|nr:hypothetical protein [Inhella crocodyli]RVT82362.1 hypothetical protein EOD73_16625 [Inhella crocodyli]
MSDDTDTWGFAPPPFNAEASLVQFKRSLREMGLSERASGFELKGRQALAYELKDGAIALRLARRLTLRTPDWDAMAVRSGADQRKVLDEIKRRLARWQDED